MIHPWFTVYGGGELVCLYVCKTLQESGYKVVLACDVFDPAKAEAIYSMGEVMRKCVHLKLEPFNPVSPKVRQVRFFAVQRLLYNIRIRKTLENLPCDIVFSTQSSVFMIRRRPVYHFLYSIVDLFAYPSFIAQEEEELSSVSLRVYFFLLRRLRDFLVQKPKPRLFLALSENVRQELVARGHPNSVLVYPPARMMFHPREKKNRIVTASRIVPQKNLELFMAIASKLPQYEFLIIGRDTEELRRFNPGYSEKIRALMGFNVRYVEAAVKDVPRLVEESKVYLYCGNEPGIGIAIMESASAGCIPIAPMLGGGGEVVDSLGMGFKFTDLEDAVRKVRMAMEESCWTPREIAEQATRRFDPSIFEQEIRNLL